MGTSTFRFGFLDYRGSYQFIGGSIVPLEQLDEAVGWVNKYAHKDGFLYPPLGHQQMDSGELVPNFERPQHLHQVPATHELTLDRRGAASDLDRVEARFVVQLIAFLHRTWVQFEDWWFDARIRLSKYSLHLSPQIAEHLLSHAFRKWHDWPESAQKHFIAILFMFNRAPSYEWDWERFLMEYMVFDAIFNCAGKLNLAPDAITHSQRINGMCQSLGLHENAALSKEFVRLRNDLVHEALWDSVQPGTKSSGEAFMSHIYLRQLNQRLMLALLGYRNEFVYSTWWTRGAVVFDMPPVIGP